MLLDQLYFASKRIKERFLESLMVVLGLGLGIGIVTAIFAATISFNKEINDNTSRPWLRQLRIMPASHMWSDEPIYKIGQKDSQDIFFELSELEEVKQLCSSIDYGFIQFWLSFNTSPEGEFSGDTSWWERSIQGNGVSNDFFPFNKLELSKGTLFSQEDFDNSNRVMVIGENIAQKLFKDREPIGQKLTYEDITYTVIGILKAHYDTKEKEIIEDLKDREWDKNNKIYIPYTSVPWFSQWNKITELSFGVENPDNVRKAVKELNSYIKKDYKENEAIVEHSLDNQEKGNQALSKMLFVIGLIGVTALIIAALNNLNLMLARVLRQKKEMGISLALGSTKKGLFINVLIETSILGILGGAFGIILSKVFVHIINVISEGSRIKMGIVPLIISIGLSVILTFLFSVYPGIEATKTNPSTVLRQD